MQILDYCCCKPQEPDYIAALSTKFIKNFNILVAVFPKYEFSVSGVYCHQKPIVDIHLDKKPELGDILFVYVGGSNCCAAKIPGLCSSTILKPLSAIISFP